MQHAISWFEIPASDLDRAKKFYEAILNIEMFTMELDGYKMVLFPIEDPMTGIGGALVTLQDGFYNRSSTDGVLIYLNGNPDVQDVLSRVEAAGGKIVVPKTQISPEYGFMGVIIDSEGNRIGLHSVPRG